MRSVTLQPYLRFPSLHGDRLAFIAEDDVWLAPLGAGGPDGSVRAWRLTADSAPVAHARISPDGAWVAFTSRRDGVPEVGVVPTDGSGPARRLTWWGDAFTRVIGWTAEGQVLATTAAGQAFRDSTWAYAVPLDGGPARRLPLGPLTGLAPGGPGGAVLLGVCQNRRGAASWKRYRGGTAGALWIDPTGSGTFEPFLRDVRGQLEDPAWIDGRAVFLSDHEGWGNVYSAAPDGTDVRRHTDHGDAYARTLATHGARAVYASLGDIHLLDALDSGPVRLDVVLGGGGAGRRPAPLKAADALGDLAPDATGRASAVEVRGTVHWLTHRDGPARALVDAPGVRGRLPRVTGGAGATGSPSVVLVTDADGDDALEVVPVDGAAPAARLASGRLGRVLDLAASPDGRLAAVAAHDGRVLLVDLGSGDVREVDATGIGDATGLAFSPDSAWLAWSAPGPVEALRNIRMARTGAGDAGDGGDGGVIDVTRLRFADTDPVFTPDGKYLAFLSSRTFDPVYDAHVFEMAFPTAIRPYLLPLAAGTPSPFDPQPGGRPVEEPGDDAEGSGGKGDADRGADPVVPPVVVDLENLDVRAVPLPVAAGRIRHLQAGDGALLWLSEPPAGELGDAGAPGADRPRPSLERYDLRKRTQTTLVEELDGAHLTGDGKRLLVRDGSAVRVLPADREVKESDDDARVDVDLGRLRVTVDPVAQWRQMFDENGRLIRDHFWVEDFAGVDWPGVLERYRPLVDRLGSRDDLSELLWEVLGELGASHAYESPPERPVDAVRRLGHLGADLERAEDGVWRVARVVPGEPSAPAARSPLQAPGVVVLPGDAVVAVDGRPVDPVTGPGALLVGAAGSPVELAVERAGSAPLRFAVRPLGDERVLRYQAWVADRRRAVHELTGGRVGYLHVPDMVANGWAQLHRDLHVEVARDALVVDVRHNNGGHLSELVLERLARTVRGWGVARHWSHETYPSDARRGPLVAVTDQWAGSDGDIVTAGFGQLGLGPVVGRRTWGGVIGIDGRYTLVDGTEVTQPRYSFWLEGHGWGVENHGVDPDVDVDIAPQDWAAGRDPQLETAVQLALEALATTTVPTPPDTAGRPDRRPPVLPPRG